VPARGLHDLQEDQEGRQADDEGPGLEGPPQADEEGRQDPRLPEAEEEKEEPLTTESLAPAGLSPSSHQALISTRTI
jgi:hypothetical protein